MRGIWATEWTGENWRREKWQVWGRSQVKKGKGGANNGAGE
jgi:hypothetical protein